MPNIPYDPGDVRKWLSIAVKSSANGNPYAKTLSKEDVLRLGRLHVSSGAIAEGDASFIVEMCRKLHIDRAC